MECPDGMCPVRHALEQLEKLGGAVQPFDDSSLVRGGGVKPCCDIVLDEVRYLHESDVLDRAHGVAIAPETVQQTVTRYMQPVCRVTARMIERTCAYIEKMPRSTITPMDILPSMTLSALQHNLNEIARACKATAPVLVAQKPIPSDVTKNIDYAGVYARELERQHIIACQWMASIIMQ